MKIIFTIEDSEEITLNPIKDENSGDIRLYNLIDQDNEVRIRLKENESENGFSFEYCDIEIIDSKSVIYQKLDNLYIEIIESEQNGTELSEGTQKGINPYNPDDIKVSNRPFNLTLINDMIDQGYLDLNPDFQRNFVWDRTRKSRLIESILLRIPLPMFYFSEDYEGRISVVDGLQRLTTIREFIQGKFKLSNLEYLSDTCNGLYYKAQNKDLTDGLPAKYFRWFNMTQIQSNVIDPSSPSKVKFDIFRRINEGGRPLNNQEIRNCLATNPLRKLLHKMTNLESFQSATQNSIKSTRMEDQDVCLRFIRFYDWIEDKGNLQDYNGNMESTLDDTVENLSKKSEDYLNRYIEPFDTAMKNALYLFGPYAFRKVRPEHLKKGARRQLINKALFLTWSVVLAEFELEVIKSHYKKNSMARALANEIKTDEEFFNYLTYGTNGKSNLLYIHSKCVELLDNVFLESN